MAIAEDCNQLIGCCGASIFLPQSFDQSIDLLVFTRETCSQSVLLEDWEFYIEITVFFCGGGGEEPGVMTKNKGVLG